jgi:hypothetical protein
MSSLSLKNVKIQDSTGTLVSTLSYDGTSITIDKPVLAPTAPAGANNTQLATTAFVKSKSELDSIGVGQMWQTPTGMQFNVTYTNTSGKPIVVNIVTNGATNADQGGHVVQVGGVSASGALNVFQGNVGGNGYFTSTIVPNNQTYMLVKAPNTNQIALWSELR